MSFEDFGAGVIATALILMLIFIFSGVFNGCQETYTEFCNRHNMTYDNDYYHQEQCLELINETVTYHDIERINRIIYFEEN